MAVADQEIPPNIPHMSSVLCFNARRPVANFRQRHRAIKTAVWPPCDLPWLNEQILYDAPSMLGDTFHFPPPRSSDQSSDPAPSC